MKKHKYRVVREHHGDRFYAEGDERIETPVSVKHLVPHVLEDLGPADAEPAPEPEADAEKAEPEHQNKAEDDPQNKAITASPANKSTQLAAGKAATKAD